MKRLKFGGDVFSKTIGWENSSVKGEVTGGDKRPSMQSLRLRAVKKKLIEITLII